MISDEHFEKLSIKNHPRINYINLNRTRNPRVLDHLTYPFATPKRYYLLNQWFN